MKHNHQNPAATGIIVLIICLCIGSAGSAVYADEAGQYITKGKTLLQQGHTEQAAIALEQAFNRLDQVNDTGRYLDTVTHWAFALQSLGYHEKALHLYERIKPIVAQNADLYRKAQFFNSLADINLSLGNKDQADQYLEQGMAAAREANHPQLMASVLINAGNLLAADNDFDSAYDAYSEALEWTDKASDATLLTAKIKLNLFQITAVIGDEQEVKEAMDQALKAVSALPVSHAKGAGFISLSLIIQEIQNSPDLPDAVRKAPYLVRTANQALTQARQIAAELENPKLAAIASGYLGQLYESSQRYAEAAKLTRIAIFNANQGNYQDVLYLWHWQLGRLHKAMGNIPSAIQSYRNSIDTLTPIRAELFRGLRLEKDIFNQQIKPVYLGLAELYLSQGNISQARDTMEILKTAELQDFFQDECVTAMQADVKTLDKTPAHTAVIYPIVLPNELAILLTLPDGIQYISVPVTDKTLNATVDQFRLRLQNRMNNRFLYEAEQLYNWIIRPIERILSAHNIDTLIFAPDGALRLVPVAALYDGTYFLTEKYAITIIPAITLTDPQPFKPGGLSILLCGISEARQDFSPLPSVPAELNDIKAIMNARTVMMNPDFTVPALTQQFKSNEYSILHIATHGIFGGTPQESYLLTYETKLTMDGLEELIALARFRENPVELLTLSACQTAMGNERAALGLAGVALKAGVRSAIATLWYVDDEATSLAIRDFYRQIQTPGLSKAKALQNVQKNLIAKPRYWHPFYWEQFVLIGNWM